MAIAFFDLDKTLLPWNSATVWVRSEMAAGKISWRQALRGYYWILRYQLGFTEVESVYREALRVYAGDPEEEVAGRTVEFYRSFIQGHYRPGAREALERHRAAGDQLVLLTSSSPYLSALVAEELALDGFISSVYEVDDTGVITGQPAALCVGNGKRTLAEAYATERGIALGECTFYTDSASDLPALEAVGTPVAVNPDPKLRRAARSRGWQIADWGA